MSKFGRNLVFLIFMYTCVEGLVINILYPNYLAFIFKDFAIVVLYLGMLGGAQPSMGSLRRLSAPFAVFALILFVFMLLPSPVGLLAEAVALKQRLFYIPLCYAGYQFSRDEEDVKALMRVMAWSSIPVSLFGLYLFFVGPSGLTALGANYSAVVWSTAGEHNISFFRSPGPFNSPGQYGIYMLANGILFIGVLFLPGIAKNQRFLTLVALVTLTGALLVSGSRTPMLVMLMCGSLMLVLMGKIQGLGVWAVGLYSVLTLGFSMFGDGVKDRVGSIASWEHVERFQATYFGDLFLPYLQQAPMGFGLGVATIGARHFAVANTVWMVESYFAVLAVETGIFGVLALLYLVLAISILLLRSHSAMARSPFRSFWYASSIFVLFLALFTPINTSLDGAPGNMYFWFFLGVSVRLADLEVARSAGLRAGHAVYRGGMGQPA